MSGSTPSEWINECTLTAFGVIGLGAGALGMSEFFRRVPGDKSLTHRALILAAFADGESVVRSPLVSEDTESTIRVLRQLGAAVQEDPDGTLRVRGCGGEFQVPQDPLDCGNSGTTARLMLGVLAGTGLPGVVTGDASLRSRPSRRVTDPLRKMGAEFEIPDDEGWPVRVLSGVQSGLKFRTPVASAQVKSALLLAGLAAQVPVEIDEPYLSRDHTERLLGGLGMGIETVNGTIKLQPGPVPPFEAEIAGDPSSAAFLFGAGLLTGSRLQVDDLLLNPTRIGFLSVMERMGASVEVTENRTSLGEPVGSVRVEGDSLTGTSVGPPEIPGLIDEVPILAVLAAVAHGETTFEGVGELRVKESDRLARLEANLVKLGVNVSTSADTLKVSGPMGTPVRAVVETGGDHRIAMAFSTLGAYPGVDVELSERTSPNISFPGFFAALADVTSA